MAGPRPAYLEVMGFPQPGPRAETPRHGTHIAPPRRSRRRTRAPPLAGHPAPAPSARPQPAHGPPTARAPRDRAAARVAEAGSACTNPTPTASRGGCQGAGAGLRHKGESSLASADTNPPAPRCLKGRRGRRRGAAEADASSTGVRKAWAQWSAHFAVTGLRLHARSPAVRALDSVSSQDLCERVAPKFCGCLQLLPRRPTHRSSPGKGGARETRPPVSRGGRDSFPLSSAWPSRHFAAFIPSIFFSFFFSFLFLQFRLFEVCVRCQTASEFSCLYHRIMIQRLTN